MKKILILLFSILLAPEVMAQDFHFSQFYSGPLNLNPALTGSSELTRMGVNAIEIGRYEPKLDLVRAIHKRFGTPYSWLLDGDSKDMDMDKIKGEVESLRKIVLDQKELIETQKKLIVK